MLNVICLKHGNKYDAGYVNKLFNMVSRHLTIPCTFNCFTDDPLGIDPRVNIKILPDDINLSGWWWKPYIFKTGHFTSGDTNLFFDLDMVIIKNIDNLVTYKQDQFLGLCDVGRVFNRSSNKLGSAVLRWPANKYHHIWDSIHSDPTLINRFNGDQDWIWHLCKQSIQFFPNDWIISYKWEARNRTELIRVGSRWNFKTVRSPELPPNTCVLAFHGSPDPHEVSDAIIIDNWQ
jgi:hypothetical protein